VSGIAGIIHFDGRPVEPGQVEAMTAAMHYRGPDGIDHWRRGNVALGQCMLRTTPESLEETQPLTNEDESLVLVMDGRVDNWEELRRELLGKGTVLRTRADAELVLRAYEVWGRECLPHIDGDFALVIWDARRHEAFCARDRMGNKPFVYHWIGKTLYFASEQQAILRQAPVVQVLNEDMVAEYLAAEWYSSTETLWQGVLRLEAAHSLTATASGSALKRYWAPDLQASLSFRNDEECAEHYRALLFDVVRRHSRASHPVACEVSGGLDSSAVFAVAETLRRQGQLPAPGLEGYTLDFSGDPDADEIDYCRAVGTHLGKAIHEITPSHVPLSWYQEIARHYRDFPDFPNGGEMGLPIAERAHANGARVLMNGLGGDQWLGGAAGASYTEAVANRQGRELLKIMAEDLQHVGLKTTMWQLLRHGLVPLMPKPAQAALRSVYVGLRRTGEQAESLAWLAAPMRTRALARRQACHQEFVGEARHVGQIRQLACLYDAYQMLAIEMSERYHAQAGLELRQPFWNAKMVEFAMASPERSRERGDVNKWLHRRAMQDLLPEAVLGRKCKAEFSIMFTRHLTALAPHMTATVLPRRAGWVDERSIRSMLRVCSDVPPSQWQGMDVWALWSLFGVDAVLAAAPLTDRIRSAESDFDLSEAT